MIASFSLDHEQRFLRSLHDTVNVGNPASVCKRQVVFVFCGWFGRNLLLFKAGGFVSFFPLSKVEKRNAGDSLLSRLRNCSLIKIPIHFFLIDLHVDHTAILRKENSHKIRIVGDFCLRSIWPFLTETAVGGCKSSNYISSLIGQFKPTLTSQVHKREQLSFFHE